MDTARVKITHPEGVVYANVWDDFAWIHQHRQTLYQTYGESVILVYQKAVVGHGKTIQAAVIDAESHLMPDTREITPVVYHLANPYRLRRFTSQES